MQDRPSPEELLEAVAGFLRDYWLWWLLPLIVAVLVAVAMLWIYEGDATSPFLYPER